MGVYSGMHPSKPRLPAMLALFLAALITWSCNTSSEDDVYTVTFKLDPARVGKFDSVLVEIYNGAVPDPGDTAKPAQRQVIKVSPTTTQVSLKLNSKVEKDFSVVITGFSGDAIIYRNLHEVEGFSTPDTSKHSVLLISRIVAENLTVSVGETRAPILILTPSDAGDKRIVLASMDSTIVKVVGDSLLGVKAGSIKVAAANFDQSIKVEFTVTVTAIRVTDLVLDSLSIKVGDSLAPAIVVLPVNATDKDFSIESSNSSLVEVVGKSIKGVKAGKTQLILISKDGGAKDTVPITVRLAVTGIKGSDQVKQVNDRFIPVLEFTPSDATRQGYILKSSDSTKVAVAGDSLVAMAVGTVTITVKSDDGGFTSDFKVQVDKQVFRVKGVKTSALRILMGDTVAPDITWDPVNASDQGFTLVSLDTSVVAPTETRLNGLKAGKATVVVVSVDGGFKDSIEVTVELPNFKSDVLPITSIKCAPCHEPGQIFNWQDSAQLVLKGTATVDRLTRPDSSAGKMPLKGAPNGTLSARQLKILLDWLGQVSLPVKSVTMADMAANLGDSVLPAITWDPPNASNQIVTITTSDTTLAPVAGRQIVPMATGTYTVFVETDEGKRKLQAKLVVSAPQFTKNVLPITMIKCSPCHEPGQTFDFQDSTMLILSGARALDRLQRDPLAAGKMPLRGSPNGDLSPLQKAVILAWLNAKVIPLKGITVSDDSLMIDQSKAPKIIYDPPTANNKAYFLASSDTAKLGIDGGEYVGRSVGTVQVEVRALDGDFLKLISVKVKPVPVDSLIAVDSAGSIGDTLVPRIEFFPANATEKEYTLSLLRASTIVSIVTGGKSVVGTAIGKDTVLASTLDGLIKSKFLVTVGPVAPKGIAVRDTNNVIGVLVSPTLVWNPATTTNKNFTLTIAAADTLIAAVRSLQVLGKTVGAVNVTVKSVADTSIQKTFIFTVGPVPLIGITAAATTQFASTSASLNARAFITWSPTNVTDKRFTLVSSAPAKIPILTDTTIRPLKLGLTAVTVKAVSDTSKKATWNVTVVRPPFTGAIKNIFTTKCQQCHGPVAWPTRNWQDSAQVVSFSALIKTRINSADATIMPPLGPPAPTAGPLTPAEITALTTWLNFD